MQVADECDHGSDPMCCPVCRGPLPVDPPEIGPTIEATWPGQCRDCGHRIEVGDSIARVDIRWVHEHCAEEMARG